MAARNGSPSAPRKRRHLLRALAETPVLPHRSASLASPAQRPTLGALVRRDPVYAPPTSLLGRLAAPASGGCAPPRQRVLVATAVEHPFQGGVSPLLGARALHPPRSAANLLHQMLRALWSLDEVPVAEVPESGAQPRADGESCGSEQRPARSSAPLESQAPPPEEIVEVAEPPQAEATHPQTCEGPCGPVGPGARSLAAKTARGERLDPRCGKHEDAKNPHTPFTVETPSERGKGGGQSCPCVCVCTRIGCPPAEREPPDLPSLVVLEAVDTALGWLGRCWAGLRELLVSDSSAGVAAAEEFVGTIAVHRSGTSPTLDALLGGQSQGLGMSAGSDLELGVMRPALTLTSLSTSGIPGPGALAPPELPGGEPSFILALRAQELARLDGGAL